MLNQLASKIRKANLQKGFDLSDVQTGTQLMLVVSELSEALEAVRNGRYCDKESVQGLYDWYLKHRLMIFINE